MKIRVIYAVILLFTFFLLPSKCVAVRQEFEYVKAEVITEPEIIDEGQLKEQKFRIRILSGQQSGLMTHISTKLWENEGYNSRFSKGDKISVKVIKDYDGTFKFLVMGHHRSSYIYISFIIFIFIFLSITGFNKLNALLMLIVNVTVALPVLIFVIKAGYSPVLSALFVAGAGIVLTIAVVLGKGKKLISAAAGSFVGTATAGILTLIFMDYMHIEGNFSLSARMIQTASRFLPGWNIMDLKGVVAAGIMMASLGAVIDVAVSIVAAMSEIYLKSSKTIEPLKLFKSGMNVGRDVISTMLNSLVFVFVGLSLPIFLVFRIMDIPLLKIINFEFILITILAAVISSIALMATVPITAYISSKVLTDA